MGTPNSDYQESFDNFLSSELCDLKNISDMLVLKQDTDQLKSLLQLRRNAIEQALYKQGISNMSVIDDVFGSERLLLKKIPELDNFISKNIIYINDKDELKFLNKHVKFEILDIKVYRMADIIFVMYFKNPEYKKLTARDVVNRIANFFTKEGESL